MECLEFENIFFSVAVICCVYDDNDGEDMVHDESIWPH